MFLYTNHILILQLPDLPLTYSDLTVSGDDEGIFGVESGFLYALKPLDREKQPSYSLQVQNHKGISFVLKQSIKKCSFVLDPYLMQVSLM